MPQLKNGYLYQNYLAVIFWKIKDTFTSIIPRKKRELPARVTKILILKPDHLGDMLLLTTVLPLIQSRFPDARMDIVGNRWNLEILDNNPYIVKKYEVNHFKINRERISWIAKVFEYFRTYNKTLKEIKQEKYDVCLSMRAYGLNLIRLARKGKCRYIIGHSTGGNGPLLDRVVSWNPGRHETEHYLEVLTPLGIRGRTDKLKYELYPSNQAKTKVDKVIKIYKLKKKFAVIHPGAGDLRKSLPIPLWKKIIRLLEEKNLQVVITGSAGEKKLAKEIAGSRSIIICGELSLHELGLLFKKSSIIITVDTLSAHLGAWSKVNTMVFHCGINDVHQWHALGTNTHVLSNYCKSAPCFTGCETMECMDFDLDTGGL